MRLPDNASAAAEARRYVRRWAAIHGLPEGVTEQAELIVDELVTNAVRHAIPPFELEISPAATVVHGEVTDSCDTFFSPETRDFDSGFGLMIVDAESSRWGVSLRPEGKKVWFEIDLTD
jgi:hypothetical protein